MDVTPHFTDEFKNAVAASREHAIRLGNNFIGPEHIVLGFISVGDGTAYRRLNELTDLRSLSEKIGVEMQGRTITVPEPAPGVDIEEGAVVMSDDAEAVITEAMVSATEAAITGEHVLATMLRINNSGRSLLNSAGITSETFGQG